MKLMHPFKLSIGDHKCDNADDDDGAMIPVCRPWFAGGTEKVSNGILIGLTDQGKIWVKLFYEFIVLL